MTSKHKSLMLWLNSQFYSSSSFINSKFYEMTFDIPQITLFKPTKLKVVSYIHQSTSAKQMIIRIKNLLYDGLSSYPLNHPILYVANTNVESQLKNSEYSLSLLPQTINSLTLVLDEQFITNFNGIGNHSVMTNEPNQSVYVDVYRNDVILNPIVWYKFDNSADIGLDSMGNHNLTNNSIVYNSTNFVRGTGSATFAGANFCYLVKSTGFANLNNTDFTLSFWSYRTNTTASNRYFFQIGNNTIINNKLYQFYIYRTFQNKFLISFVNDLISLQDTTPYLNEWVFIAFAFEASTRQCKFFVNGVNIASKVLLYDFEMTQEIRVGTQFAQFSNFQGQYDDFRIYNYYLSANEINFLYNNMKPTFVSPRFVLGLSIEEADMEVYNSVNRQ